MSDLTHQQTHDTKAGLSASDTKTQLRAKKKQPKIKEVEATVHIDGGITYHDELSGEEKAYVVDSMEDYHWIFSECQIMGKQGFEVSNRLFDMLSKKTDTPYIITGTPAVFIYREGTMVQTQKKEMLDIEDLNELRAHKARKEADKLKSEKDALKEQLIKEIEV